MLGFSTVVLIAASVCLVDAHPDGAPAEACDTLTPNHNGHVGQTSEVPYVINLTQFDVGNGSYVYSPGRIYALTLAAPTGQMFEGFFVQSRLAADDTTRVGVFAVDDADNSRLSSCVTDTDGITHTNDHHKTSATMQWTAPPVGTGTIQFAYATVHEFDIFWADQRSEELMEGEPADGSTSAQVVSMLSLLISGVGAVLLP